MLVGVIRVHGNTFDGRGLGIYQLPTLAAIRTAPQAAGLRVHRLGIPGVENKEAHHFTQIEHPPGAPAVMRDVSARHIASDQYGVDIMRADGGVKHGSSATGTDDMKIAGPSPENVTQAGEDNDNEQPGESNPDLFSC